jgi:argininosuccinate synthase
MTLTRVRNTEPVDLTVSFIRGAPVSIDGVEMPLADLIKTLNDRAGATGFGRIDMVENRRVGIKSREVYECPAALALIAAHADIEDLVLERDVHHEKARLETRWAELVYDGMWFSPLKEALDAFIGETQVHVTGDVRLRFEAPGLMRIVGRRSPKALYDYGLATYDAEDTFRHADSEGFVKIYGLGVKTWAARQGAKNATPPRS